MKIDNIKKVITCLLLSSLFVLYSQEIKINKKTFPLPSKYAEHKTSEQGLRDSIPNVNAYGGFSLNQYHYAIDYWCPDKTEVYACDYGYVVNVYPSYYNGGKIYTGHPTYGGLIEIRHFDNTTSLYAHLSFTKVKEGDYVKKGDCIGWSGGVRGRRGSGNSTAPHLHFCIYLDIESLIEY